MPASLRVALRADVSPQIGTGHITRCTALARALATLGATSRLFSRPLGVQVEPLLKSSLDFVYLPSPVARADIRGPVPHAAWAEVDWETDADATIAAARDFAPSHLVVDHYAFDARWHRKVARALGVALIVIDDLADRDLDGTLLVDHNLAGNHREKYGVRWPRERPLLGGPAFALLDASYAEATRARVIPKVTRVGIFMGGADLPGYSLRVLSACREVAGFTGDIEIAVTDANPHLAALREMCERQPNTRLCANLPDLAAFHARQDLEVGAGGGASWERCCIGVPTLLIATADNQTIVVEELKRAQAAAATVPMASPDVEAIGKAIQELLSDQSLRQTLSQNAMRLVDGLGTVRVALRIAADTLTLRRAEPGDAQRIYQWRNHPSTRAVSGDDAEISWDTHRAWYERALADASRALFVAMIGSRAAGVIRFDLRDDGYQEISLFLDPALHGLGLGWRMLRAGEAALGPTARFRAKVVEDNLPSQAMFVASGYLRAAPGIWLKEPVDPLN